MSLAQSINLANYFSPPGPYFAHFCSNAIVENSVNITRHGSVLISIGGTWRSVRYRKHLAARDQHTDRTVGEIYGTHIKNSTLAMWRSLQSYKLFGKQISNLDDDDISTWERWMKIFKSMGERNYGYKDPH